MNAKPRRRSTGCWRNLGNKAYCRSVSERIGSSDRQQIPKSRQSRNHGLLARVSSCLRFAAETSLALRGLISGASNISSSCSMSSIMRSTFIRNSIANQLRSQPNERAFAALNCQPQKNIFILAKTFGKTVVIEAAGHKIPQNAGLPLAVDVLGSNGGCCSEAICSRQAMMS